MKKNNTIKRKVYFKTLIKEIKNNDFGLINENKKIVICDVLNYDELKKLINSLGKLKFKNFVKEIKITNPTILKIMPIMGNPLKNCDIGYIEFKQNFFVVKIKIRTIQINSCLFIILYEVYCKESLNDSINFIVN